MAGASPPTGSRLASPPRHRSQSSEDERARHASELDRAAGRAWQHGDLQRAARLIADARALDPSRGDLWNKREATIAAAAPRTSRRIQPETGGYWRTCTAPHPHQDAYLAARRSAEIGDTGRCHDGHPVSDLHQDVSARLTAAGFTARAPELVRIRAWNRTALERDRIASREPGHGGRDDMTLVSAREVREHVLKLRAAGGTYESIGRAAGTGAMTVHGIANARRPTVQADIAGRLLAVTEADIRSMRSSPTGIMWRLRALIAMGHTCTRMAAATGIPPATVRRIVRGEAITISPN